MAAGSWMPQSSLEADPKRFCALFLALTAALALLPLLIARTRIYPFLSGYPLDIAIEYPFTLHNESFDVVLYGDSAGLFGVDPRIVARRTGLSAVNLCRTGGILDMTGDFTLDWYLKHNHSPSVIVLVITPRNATLSRDRSLLGYYEGAMLIFRHGSAGALGHLFLSGAASDLAFWTEVVKFSSFDSALVLRRDHLRMSELRGNLGYFPLTGHTGLADGCTVESMHGKALDHSYIDQFTRKYTKLGIAVLVYIAPVADCDQSLPYYQRVLAAVADNEPGALPHSLIADDQTYAHPLPEAVPDISMSIAAVVERKLPGVIAARHNAVPAGRAKHT